jgi:hypothetical protein
MVEKYRTNVCEIVKACGFNVEPDSPDGLPLRFCAPQVFMFITATLYKQQTTNKQSIK